MMMMMMMMIACHHCCKSLWQELHGCMQARSARRRNFAVGSMPLVARTHTMSDNKGTRRNSTTAVTSWTGPTRHVSSQYDTTDTEGNSAVQARRARAYARPKTMPPRGHPWWLPSLRSRTAGSFMSGDDSQNSGDRGWTCRGEGCRGTMYKNVEISSCPSKTVVPAPPRLAGREQLLSIFELYIGRYLELIC